MHIETPLLKLLTQYHSYNKCDEKMLMTQQKNSFFDLERKYVHSKSVDGVDEYGVFILNEHQTNKRSLNMYVNVQKIHF